jgi:hypothetical protein
LGDGFPENPTPVVDGVSVSQNGAERKLVPWRTDSLRVIHECPTFVVRRALPTLPRSSIFIVGRIGLETRLTEVPSILAEVVVHLRDWQEDVNGQELVSCSVIEILIFENTCQIENQ